MARPKKCRRVCNEPLAENFMVNGEPADNPVQLTVDEYEVIRLIDYMKLTQEQCAVQVEVSRTTITDIYESARFKIAEAIVSGRGLIIGGGNYKICEGGLTSCCRLLCMKDETESGESVIMAGCNGHSCVRRCGSMEQVCCNE